MKAIVVCLSLSLLASEAFAQAAPAVPTSTLSFEYLVLAQIDVNDGQPQLVVTVDAYHTQRRNIVTPENRIRLDTADGKTLLLKYGKGRSATVESDALVAIIPVGKKQIKVSAREFRFYQLDGRSVPMAEATKLLKSSRPIFLLDDTDADPPSVSQVYQQALDADCLIAMTRERIRETKTDIFPDLEPETPPQPAPPQ